MEQYAVDTRPYLATAVARNTKAYRAVRKIYYEKIAECEALREALYRSTEHITESEANEKPKHLPDELRIVCIGGHDRWITAMKTLLPLTYIHADVTPDMAVIRNASAVWFFAEYMSHRQFTPIIECCRTNRVPVYYFSRSGAEHCAEEILDQHGII